jgi:hypothetical protein
MATPYLRARTVVAPATRRLAASSVAPVYASALSYTHFCVISNADAYRVSALHGTICSEGDR